MGFFEIWILGGVSVWLMMTLMWLLSLYLRNSSIVDPFWGTGFVVVAWVYASMTPGFEGRKALLLVLVTIWGLRLSLHLLWRNRGKGEDYRYARWREQNGPNWWWFSYLKVFLLQGVILWIVSLPLLGAQFGESATQLTLLDVIAMLVWGLGFFFEALGDWQLARFKADPANKGQVMDRGLWRYTRHPNYFGDAVQWWGFYLFALASGAWWTIISPVLMNWLLLRVSGVAMLEADMKKKRPAYAEYIARTSAFVPRPPKQ